jgi:hypothetical protein
MLLSLLTNQLINHAFHAFTATNKQQYLIPGQILAADRSLLMPSQRVR